jgi:hypothetical protein
VFNTFHLWTQIISNSSSALFQFTTYLPWDIPFIPVSLFSCDWNKLDKRKPSNSKRHNFCALLAHRNYFLYTYHSVWRFAFLEYWHVVTDYERHLITLLQLYLWVIKHWMKWKSRVAAIHSTSGTKGLLDIAVSRY